MKHAPRTFLIAAAALALAACTSGNVRPGSVSTAVKAGQSWVVTRPAVAAQVLDTCARDNPGRGGEITGYWAPSRQDVDALERHLDALQPQIAAPALAGRQYVGFERGGKQLIYINAFQLPDHSQTHPAREAVRSCTHGEHFWGAVYDPQTATFTEVLHNGTTTP